MTRGEVYKKGREKKEEREREERKSVSERGGARKTGKKVNRKDGRRGGVLGVVVTMDIYVSDLCSLHCQSMYCTFREIKATGVKRGLYSIQLTPARGAPNCGRVRQSKDNKSRRGNQI